MTVRRQNPRTKKPTGPTLKERLEQEEAALKAEQTTGDELAIRSEGKQEENEIEQPAQATEELELVAFPNQTTHQQSTPDGADVAPSEAIPPLAQQPGAFALVQEQAFNNVTPQVHSSEEGVRPGATDKPKEAVPAPGFPYIVERKQLSARIDIRLIKAMQHLAIDSNKKDYELWEDAARALLRERGTKA